MIFGDRRATSASARGSGASHDPAQSGETRRLRSLLYFQEPNRRVVRVLGVAIDPMLARVRLLRVQQTARQVGEAFGRLLYALWQCWKIRP